MKTQYRSLIFALCSALVAGPATAEENVHVWPASGGTVVKRWHEEPTYTDEAGNCTFGTRRLAPTPADQHTQNSYRGYIWFDLSTVPAGAAISYASLPILLSDAGPSTPCTRAIGFLGDMNRAEWNGLDAFQRYTSAGSFPFEWDQSYPSAAYDANHLSIFITPGALWRRTDFGIFLRITSDDNRLALLDSGSLFGFSDSADFVEEPSDQLTVKYARAPGLLSPADDAVLDELEPVVLQWAQVLDSDSPLRYRIQYSSDPNFSTDVTSGALGRETTQFGIGYIAAGTRIYWRLRVEEAAAGGTSNFSAWSAPRSFITEGRYGALRVDISPPAVAQAALESERGQWQVDDRDGWNDSGTTATALGTAMPHTVVFKVIPGWTAPPNQSVAVNAAETTVISGTYTQVAGTGGIKMDILPDSLATALDVLNRAQWRVDGGAWMDDSIVATGLSVGMHTVSFKPVSGWATPPAQVVNVLADAATGVTATYEQNGSLTVTIEPPIVRDAPFSAAWKIDNGLWWPSGTTLPVAPGLHAISFKDVTGWNAPAVQEFLVEPGMTGQFTGTYTLIPLLAGQLTVETGPAEVNTDPFVRARWSVDGVNWWFGGQTRTIPAGEWTVQFSAVPGWKTPLGVPVTVLPGGSALVSRNYGAIAPRTISGSVLADGAGLADVKVRFSNGVGDATTDAAGFYSIAVQSGWSGTATPIAPEGFALGYFDPSSRSFDTVTTDVADQSFTRIARPPGACKGSYAGLMFAEDGSVATDSTGSIALALRPSGAFSGVIRYGGLRVPLRGRFDEAGAFNQTRTVQRQNLEVALQLVAAPTADRLTGSVRLGVFIASQIHAERILYHARRNPAPQAGRYTASIQPLASPSAVLPKGFGFGAIKIGASGRARFTGRLGDGQVVSFSSPICGTEQWPAYLRFGGGNEMIAGWCRVSASTLPHPVTVADMTGALDWVGAGPSYAMALRTSLAGFRYTAPGAGERIIECPDADGNAQAIVRTAVTDAASEVRKTFTLTARNRVAFAGDPDSRMTIMPKTGLFSGRMMDAGGVTRPIHGAFLRSQKRAFGFVLADDNTRPLTLAPTP